MPSKRFKSRSPPGLKKTNAVRRSKEKEIEEEKVSSGGD